MNKMDPRNIIIGVFASILVMVVLGLSIPLLNDAAMNAHLSNRLDLIEYALGASGVSPGQVLYSDADGELAGDSDMTFSTDTLSVTGLNAPTGRGATFVVAASNSDSQAKSQADYLCDGTADETEIYAAANATRRSYSETIVTGNFTLFDDMDDPVSGGGTYTWAALQGDETLTQETTYMNEGSGCLKVVGTTSNDPGAKVTGLSMDISMYDMCIIFANTTDLYIVRLTLKDSNGYYYYYHAPVIESLYWDTILFDFVKTTGSGGGGTFDSTDLAELDIELFTKDDSSTTYIDYVYFTSWTELTQATVVHGESISSGATTYTRGTDYEIDYVEGRLRPISEGSITEGQSLTAAYYYGAGRVKLLAGKYNLSSHIDIGDHVSIEGEGDNTYLFLANNSNSAMIRSELYGGNGWPSDTDNGIGAGNVNVSISNLILDTNESNNSGRLSPICLVECKGVHLENIKVINSGYNTFWNIQLSRCTDIYAKNIYANDAKGEVNDCAIFLEDCQNAVVDGVYGYSGDDLMAVNSRRHDVVGINIMNVVGVSDIGYIVTVGANYGGATKQYRKFENINIDNVVAGPGCANGIRLIVEPDAGINNVNINNFAAGKVERALYAYQHNSSTSYIENLNINNFYCDGPLRECIRVEAIKGMNLNNFVAKGAGEHSVYIVDDCFDINISNGLVESFGIGYSGIHVNGTIDDISITNCEISSAANTKGITINDGTITNFSITNNKISVATAYAINMNNHNGTTLTNGIIAYNDLTGTTNKIDTTSSTITNLQVSHNLGFVTENSGTSTGTGAEQTIAHGLSFTPDWDDIGVFSDNTTATHVYMSTAPDATNIYVTCNATGSRWHWSTLNDYEP